MTQPPELPPDPSRNWFVIPLALFVYAVLLVAGWFTLTSRYSMPVGAEISMSSKRATFFVANAATLSGFQTTVTLESLRPLGQIAVFVLMLAGAILSWLVGGILVTRALRLNIGLRSIFTAIAAMLVITVLIGAITAPAGGLWQNIFGCVSALSNCGLWIGAAPGNDAVVTHASLLPLAVVGGVGVTILIELLRAPLNKSISPHAKSTIAMMAGVYIIGAATLFSSDYLSNGFTRIPPSSARSVDVERTDWQTPLQRASSMSLNARTAGLPTALLNTLERPSQWIIAALMCLGGGSGGAAGGLKVTILAILAAGLVRVFRGERADRLFGIALVWLTGFFVVILATFLFLLGVTPEQSTDRLLMLAISATSNTGLSHDVISASGQDAYVMSITMFAGRLMPLAVLAWIANEDRPADVVAG